MHYKLILVLCLHVASIYSAPMKMQVIPLPYGMQGMQPQNSLMELNPFFRQAVPNLQLPFMYQPQPMMVIVPQPAEAENIHSKNSNDDISTNSLKANTGQVDEKKDAVVLDAEPNLTDIDFNKAVVLMPNGARNSIGQIISLIPFLPIHINVPDTISWIASQIPSNWFGGLGQKVDTQRLSNRGPVQVFMVPSPMLPQV